MDTPRRGARRAALILALLAQTATMSAMSAASTTSARAQTTAPAPEAAPETLADIRQEIEVLKVEILRLKRELVTTGGPASPIAGSSLPDRVSLIERALAQLTARTEELEHRIDRIVADGTNRIGDLEFRLCELDRQCDPSRLGRTPTLGGADPDRPGLPPAAVAPAPVAQPGGAELAVGERADFDRARAALEAGETARAAELLSAFVDSYPGSPLTGEAQFLRGRALEASERIADAARAYLDSFSSDPDGPRAPDALFRLGLMLDQLGQRQEACVTLGEVSRRYPGTAADADAVVARGRLTCP